MNTIILKRPIDKIIVDTDSEVAPHLSIEESSDGSEFNYFEIFNVISIKLDCYQHIYIFAITNFEKLKDISKQYKFIFRNIITHEIIQEILIENQNYENRNCITRYGYNFYNENQEIKIDTEKININDIINKNLIKEYKYHITYYLKKNSTSQYPPILLIKSIENKIKKKYQPCIKIYLIETKKEGKENYLHEYYYTIIDNYYTAIKQNKFYLCLMDACTYELLDMSHYIFTVKKYKNMQINYNYNYSLIDF
jgi:hypothetical protein